MHIHCVEQVNKYIILCKFWVCFLQIEVVTNAERDFDGRVDGAMLTYLSKVFVPNEEYRFRVAAINGAGNGEFSPFMTYRTNFSGRLLLL